MRRHPLDLMGEGLAGAVRRGRAGGSGFRRRAVGVRLYDSRGHAHPLDPVGEPGRRVLAAAQELVRLSGERAAGTP